MRLKTNEFIMIKFSKGIIIILNLRKLVKKFKKIQNGVKALKNEFLLRNKI